MLCLLCKSTLSQDITNSEKNTFCKITDETTILVSLYIRLRKHVASELIRRHNQQYRDSDRITDVELMLEQFIFRSTPLPMFKLVVRFKSPIICNCI